MEDPRMKDAINATLKKICKGDGCIVIPVKIRCWNGKSHCYNVDKGSLKGPEDFVYPMRIHYVRDESKKCLEQLKRPSPMFKICTDDRIVFCPFCKEANFIDDRCFTIDIYQCASKVIEKMGIIKLRTSEEYRLEGVPSSSITEINRANEAQGMIKDSLALLNTHGKYMISTVLAILSGFFAVFAAFHLLEQPLSLPGPSLSELPANTAGSANMFEVLFQMGQFDLFKQLPSITFVFFIVLWISSLWLYITAITPKYIHAFPDDCVLEIENVLSSRIKEKCNKQVWGGRLFIWGLLCLIATIIFYSAYPS